MKHSKFPFIRGMRQNKYSRMFFNGTAPPSPRNKLFDLSRQSNDRSLPLSKIPARLWKSYLRDAEEKCVTRRSTQSPTFYLLNPSFYHTPIQTLSPPVTSAIALLMPLNKIMRGEQLSVLFWTHWIICLKRETERKPGRWTTSLGPWHIPVFLSPGVNMV